MKAATTPMGAGGSARTEIEADLASLELFAGLSEGSLSQLSTTLATKEAQAGDVLMRQGEQGTSFLILLDGLVTVSWDDGGGSHTLGTAGRGATLGEMALLTRGRRHATVTAASSVRAAVGGDAAFELLVGLPGMHEQLTRIAAPRFAAVADGAVVSVADGGRFLIRPMAATDGDELAAAFARQSEDFIQRRFFTAARPPRHLIDYLVNIDYLDHFAWRVSSDDIGHIVAEGRYIRRRDDHEVADIAFDVFDEYQGRGLAPRLLGALAVAASNAGITHFVADVLYENRPMLAVLKKAHPTWRHREPGVVSGCVDVSVAEDLIQDPPRSELARTARRVITAHGRRDARMEPHDVTTVENAASAAEIPRTLRDEEEPDRNRQRQLERCRG